MTIYELHERLEELGAEERKRLYIACLDIESHELESLAVNSPRREEYCRRCLTWFANGIAVNAPDL